MVNINKEMKSIIVLVLLLAGFCTKGSTQSASEDNVLQVEKERFAAQVAKDYSALERIIGDDLYYIHSNGNTDTKASFIQAMREGRSNYDDIKMEQTKVRVFHRKTGVINGRCTYYRSDAQGKPNNLHLHYTAVYVRRSKQWQLVSWQSFRIN